MWRGGKKIKIIVRTGKKKEILLGHVWLQPHLGYFVILKSFCEQFFFWFGVRLCFLVLFYFIYIPSDVFFLGI